MSGSITSNVATLNTKINNAKVVLTTAGAKITLEDIPTPSEPYPDLYATCDSDPLDAGTYLMFIDINADFTFIGELSAPVSLGYVNIETGWMGDSGFVTKSEINVDLPIGEKGTNGLSGTGSFQTMHIVKLTVPQGQSVTGNVGYHTRTTHPRGDIKVNWFYLKMSS